MIPSEQKLQKAEIFLKFNQHKDCNEVKTLLTLIRSHLSALKDLPERREVVSVITATPDGSFLMGEEFNQCLDQVLPIVARLKAENEELKQKCRDRMDEIVEESQKVIGLQSSLALKSARVEELEKENKYLNDANDSLAQQLEDALLRKENP